MPGATARTTTNISIIVPCHNGERTVGPVLEALLAADPAPREIIVVDDGSTDRTAEIARNHPVTLLSIGENRGPSVARNTGAGAAAGTILCFVDADIVVPPDLFGALERELGVDDSVCALVVLVNPDSAQDHAPSDLLNLRLYYGFTHVRRAATGLCTSCVAIRRRCFDDVGGFEDAADRAVNDEAYLGWTLGRRGYRVGVLPYREVKHLKRMTMTDWARKFVYEGFQWVKMTALFVAETEARVVARLPLSLARPAGVALAAFLTVSVFVSIAVSPRWLAAALACALLHAAVNARQIAFVAGRRSPLRVLGFVAFLFAESVLQLAGLVAGSIAVALGTGRRK